MSKNFIFLLSAYETDCSIDVDSLDSEKSEEFYKENVKLILSLFHYFTNPDETLLRIALHLDQSSFTGSHSYKFNKLFRKIPLTYNDVLKLIFYDEMDFYPEFYSNENLTSEMRHRLRKQIEYDFARVKQLYYNYTNQSLEPELFPKNCDGSNGNVIELENEKGFQEIKNLNSLLHDMFENKKDSKTGKEFSFEFHEKIQKLYPYEYWMYGFTV